MQTYVLNSHQILTGTWFAQILNARVGLASASRAFDAPQTPPTFTLCRYQILPRS